MRRAAMTERCVVLGLVLLAVCLGTYGGSAYATGVDIHFNPPSTSLTNASGTIVFDLWTLYVITDPTVTSDDIHIVRDADSTVDVGSISVVHVEECHNRITLSNFTGEGTAHLHIDAGLCIGNIDGQPSVAADSQSFTIDNTKPTVEIGIPDYGDPVRNGTSVTYYVTFTGATTINLANKVHLVQGQGSTASGSIAVQNDTATTRKVVISNLTGDGTLGISIDAGAASDAAGNLSDPPADNGTYTFTVDNTKPGLLVGGPDNYGPVGNGTSVTYYPYTDDGTLHLTTGQGGNVHLVKTGTANGSIAIQNGTAVVISNLTGDGTLGISIDAGAASDAAGNLSDVPADNGMFTFTVDNAPPTVSVGQPSVTSTSTGSVYYSMTLGDSYWVNWDNKLHLVKTGTADGTLVVPTQPCSVPVEIDIINITGDGTLGIAIDAGIGIDPAGNPSPAVAAIAPFTVDNTAPTLSVGIPDHTSADSATTVTFVVTYTGASNITLAASDISWTKGQQADSAAAGQVTVSAVQGHADQMSIAVAGFTGVGTLTVHIGAGTAVDAAGNPAAAFDADSGTTVTVSNPGPTIAISAANPLTTNAAGTVVYTLTYTGATNITLADSDVHFVAGQGSTAAATSVVVGNGQNANEKTVTISGFSGNGTATIHIDANTAVDGSGNQAAAGDSQAFTVSTGKPTVSIGAPSVTTTTTGPVDFIVTYSAGSTITLANADVTVASSGTASGTATVSADTATTRKVTISNITGAGTLGITIAANTAHDAAGSQADAPTASTVFNVTNTGPALVIGNPVVAGSGNTLTVTYTATYSGVSSISTAASNITVNTEGTVAVDTVTVTKNSVANGVATATIVLSDFSGHGTVGISIAAKTGKDAHGHTSPAAGPSAKANIGINTPYISISAPSVYCVRPGGTDTVVYTVTIIGADTIDLTGQNIVTLVKVQGKTASAASIVASTVDGANDTALVKTRTVTLSTFTGEGTLGIKLAAGAASINSAPSAQATSSLMYVHTGPIVTISAPSSAKPVSGAVTYTVTYDGATSINLEPSNVTPALTGTATYSSITMTKATDATRIVKIAGITGKGTLAISIHAGTSKDGSDNPDIGSGVSTAATTAVAIPTITIAAPTTSGSGADLIVDFKVTYTGATGISLKNSNVKINTTGTAAAKTITITKQPFSKTGPNECHVALSNITGAGSLGISLVAGTASNSKGKTVAAGPSTTADVGFTVPLVLISEPSETLVNSGIVTYQVTYIGATTITLAAGNVTLVRPQGGAATVTVDGKDTGPVAQRTVTLSHISGYGTWGIQIAAATASNGTGNALAPTDSATFTVASPLIWISKPSAAKVRAKGSVNFTVTYENAAAIHLDPASITVNGTPAVQGGTAPTGTVSVSGTGLTTRTVTVSGVANPGTLSITIPVGSAVDGSNNKSPAATSAEVKVTK